MDRSNGRGDAAAQRQVGRCLFVYLFVYKYINTLERWNLKQRAPPRGGCSCLLTETVCCSFIVCLLLKCSALVLTVHEHLRLFTNVRVLFIKQNLFTVLTAILTPLLLLIYKLSGEEKGEKLE